MLQIGKLYAPENYTFQKRALVFGANWITWQLRTSKQNLTKTNERLTGHKARRCSRRWCSVKNTRVVVRVELTVRRCRRRRHWCCCAWWQTVNIHLVVNSVQQLAAICRRRQTRRNMSPTGQCTRTAKQTTGRTCTADAAVNYTWNALLTRSGVVSCRHGRLRFDAGRLQRILASPLLKQQ